jgi:ferredoxin
MPYGKKWSKEDARRYVDEMKGVTIPINFTIEGKQRILALSQVESLLCKADKIAITDCECRTTVKGCDAPIDVCLYLGEGAKDQIARGLGKEVSLKHALATLKRASDAGLVHVAYVDTGEKEPQYICSCCSCCCHSFVAMQEFGFNDAIISSDMIAVQDTDLCDDCGLCVEKCHFKARIMKDGSLTFDEGRCFGCGVCLTACPSDAISLKKRR